MKKDEIKIRISEKIKKTFQDICEEEGTTMSNKINNFITEEIKNREINKLDIKKIFNVKLLKFNEINGSGRIYQKNELTQTIYDNDGFETTQLEELNKNILYGQFGYLDTGEKIHKYNATHSVSNLKLEGDWLVGDVYIINQSLLPIIDNLVFRPRAFGEINEKGVVYGLEIIGFDAILKSDDKFR